MRHPPNHRRRVTAAAPVLALLFVGCSDTGTPGRDGSGDPNNRPPVARFDAPTALRPGEAGLFDGFASADPDGRIVSYAFAWGDASPLELSASPRGLHRFAAAGTYSVELSVTDDAGATDTLTHSVLVSGTPVTPGPDGSGEGSGNGQADTGAIDSDAGTADTQDAP